MSQLNWTIGDAEQDMHDIAELAGSWWDDSLFFKTFGIGYKPDMAMYKTLFDGEILLMILGRHKETDQLISCYAAVVFPYQFNIDIKMATEFVWCIHADYRNSRIFFELLKEIAKVMAEKNMRLYTLSVSQEEKFAVLDKNLSYLMFFLKRV